MIVSPKGSLICSMLSIRILKRVGQKTPLWGVPESIDLILEKFPWLNTLIVQGFKSLSDMDDVLRHEFT